MRIIERAAELLEPIEKSNTKYSALVGDDAIPDPATTERAVDGNTQRTEFPETGEATAQLSETKVPGMAWRDRGKPERVTSRTARTLSVDQDQLRRQNMITPDGERTPIAEGFRRIKRQILANVDNAKAGARSNLVLVTSALAGEGKTFCAINLAISISLEMNRTVLLVDADVANPSVPRVLGFSAEQGLMDVLLDARIDLADVLWNTDIGKLSLLPAGKAHQHSTELLASDAMRTLLQEIAERYHDRIIIFDSPPLLAASEAGVLASQMGQIVMVVEAGKTPDAALKEALSRVEPSSVAGLLLNKGEDPGKGYDFGGYG